MINPKSRSITHLIIIILIAELIIFIAISAFLNYRAAQNTIREDAKLYAESILLGIIRSIQLSDLTKESNQALVASMATETNIIRIVVVDQDLVIRNHSEPKKLGQVFAELKPVLQMYGDEAALFEKKGQNTYLTVVKPLETITGQAQKIGYAVIQTDISHEIEAALKTQQVYVAILAMFFSIGTAIIYLVVRVKIFKPLTLIKNGLEQIQQGNIAASISFESADELGAVAATFNQMTENLRHVTVSRDRLKKEIEERKRLETALVQSEKMSAIGQLAAGVAHEINNPLGVILGFAQGVARRIQPGDVFETPIKSIEREAMRCKQLVQDLLVFSRSGNPAKELIDVKETVDAALSLVKTQTKVKEISLEEDLEINLPRIQANRVQVQQILINLCNNAIDAMQSGGKLKVKVRKVEMDQKKSVQLDIQDTGAGIPEEIRSKIFEPFFTTKGIGRGTGLGLALVYEIVKKHNGKITVDSEVGKGSTFHVLLPIENNT